TEPGDESRSLQGARPGAPPPLVLPGPEVRRHRAARPGARRHRRRRSPGPAPSRARPGLRVSASGGRRGAPQRAALTADRDGAPNGARWRNVKLEGIHHITAITGDAQKNVDFYSGVLGLRLVKKTVNQDDPTVYHLFFADEKGDAGSDLTFFEYPGAPAGRAGDGMIWGIRWRLGSEDAIAFWERRLSENGTDAEVGDDGALRFSDPEGLGHALKVVETADEPLVAKHPDIPEEMALQGFDGAIAYAGDPEASRP